MDLELNGKAALITGASRGLGFASAQALVAEGCSVCITARGEEQLRAAERELNASAAMGATIRAVRADLTQAAGVEAAIAAAVGAFGGLDILVNNVGLARGGGIVGDVGRRVAGGGRSHARSRRYGPRGWPCPTCGGAAAARSS